MYQEDLNEIAAKNNKRDMQSFCCQVENAINKKCPPKPIEHNGKMYDNSFMIHFVEFFNTQDFEDGTFNFFAYCTDEMNHGAHFYGNGRPGQGVCDITRAWGISSHAGGSRVTYYVTDKEGSDVDKWDLC